MAGQTIILSLENVPSCRTTIFMFGHSWIYYLVYRETRLCAFSVIAGHGSARRADLLPVDRGEELLEFADDIGEQAMLQGPRACQCA